MKILNFEEIFRLESPTPTKPIRPFIIYGTGSFAELALSVYRDNGVLPIAICDGNQLKYGTRFFEFTIKSLEQIISEFGDFDIVIASYSFFDEIKERIEKLVPGYRFYPVNFIKEYAVSQFRDYVQQNQHKFEKIYSALEDELSQSVMENVLKGKCCHDRKYFDYAYQLSKCENITINKITGEILEKRGNRDIALECGQYFYQIPLTNKEHFIDVGACEGDTLEIFTKIVDNQYGSIHCFEPFEVPFRLLKKTKEICCNNDDRIKLYQKGLYKDNQKIGFNNTKVVGTTHINENYSNGFTVDVITLDSLKLNEVTYIKMDIEGSELEALKGAEKTIKKHKPKLAISVYHKIDDLVKIQEYIMSLGLNYKYYLRHYGCGPHYRYETVLYAI